MTQILLLITTNSNAWHSAILLFSNYNSSTKQIQRNSKVSEQLILVRRFYEAYNDLNSVWTSHSGLVVFIVLFQ